MECHLSNPVLLGTVSESGVAITLSVLAGRAYKNKKQTDASNIVLSLLRYTSLYCLFDAFFFLFSTTLIASLYSFKVELSSTSIPSCTLSSSINMGRRINLDPL